MYSECCQSSLSASAKLNEFCGWMICVHRKNVMHSNGKSHAACRLFTNKPILPLYVKIADKYNLEKSQSGCGFNTCSCK